ncbi:MAG: hypothetical protein R2778_02525 [Saprospiraceae bacterium]
MEQTSRSKLKTKRRSPKYLLESVDGIQWFGIGTLLLFFATFCVAILTYHINKEEAVGLYGQPSFG